MFVSFNETTWWVFDKGTIDEVCVPMRGKGTAETCEEESETCFASGGCCWGAKIPPAAAWGWLAGWLCCTTDGERKVGGNCRIHGGKKRERVGCKGREGERSFDGRRL